MTCEKLDSGFSATILAMIVSLRHLLGWIISSFRSREDLVLENLALRQQLLALHAQRPRTRLTALHKLVWVEEASLLGYSANRRELAWSGVSFVLGMDLKIQTSRRAQGCRQRGSRPDSNHRDRHLRSTHPDRPEPPG